MFPVETQILIVEDAKGMRDWLREVLFKFGYKNIEGVESAQQALEKVKEKQFGLMFIDLIMPGMNGLELIRMLKDDPSQSKVPLIVLSAEGDNTVIIDAINLGVLAYAIKPVSPNELQMKMREAFERFQAA